MNQLIIELKEKDQDFEFYPTTDEIIAVLVKDITKQRGNLRPHEETKLTSVLDIGAGNGKVLAALKRALFGEFYAIEKSMRLCDELPADVRLNQRFALALNVEYGRLKGWLKSGAEAADELGDKTAVKFFKSNLRLGGDSLPMLCAPEKAA